MQAHQGKLVLTPSDFQIQVLSSPRRKHMFKLMRLALYRLCLCVAQVICERIAYVDEQSLCLCSHNCGRKMVGIPYWPIEAVKEPLDRLGELSFVGQRRS
ncbi:hypothetical protein TRVL_06959 [Trypanosoma vivax]|nr:hypothetical protein TRVL_06959 [Trypanosoma vivax]